MMLKLRIIVGLLLIGMYAPVFSHDNPVIDSADYYYQKGDFKNAIEKYKSLIDSGYVAAELYYNLGNSYFRNGDFTHAILNFERAKLLDPNDEDINFNLQLAYLKVTAKNEKEPELAVNIWMKNLRSVLSSDNWAIISIVSFILLLSSVLVFLFSNNMLIKKLILGFGIFMVILTVSSFVFSSLRKSDIMECNIAIINEPTITVKSSPDIAGKDVFVAYEGTKVYVTDSIQGWRQIRLINGEVGWLPESSVIEIN